MSSTAVSLGKWIVVSQHLPKEKLHGLQTAGFFEIGNLDALGDSYSGTISFDGGLFKHGQARDFSAQYSNADNQQYKIQVLGPSQTSRAYATALTSQGGSLELQGGNLVLDGTNTYTGETKIYGGSLTVNGSLSNSTAVSVANGATYELGANDEVGSIEGAGKINLGSSTLTSGGNNANKTFSGTISGTGGLTKSGTGKLSLTGAKSFTGDTTINAGTLESEGSAMSSAVAVASGATYEIDLVAAADSATYSKSISGAGSFLKSGAGALTFDQVHSYTGSTAISGGELKISSSGSFSDSTVVDVSSGSTYQLGNLDTIAGLKGAGSVDLNGNELTVNQSASQVTFSGALSGSATGSNLRKQGLGNFILSGSSNTYSGGTFIDAGTLSISGKPNNNSGIDIDSGAVLGFDISGSQAYTGVISGAGDLRKSSSGSLQLSGLNTYKGATIISGGALSVASSGSLSDSTIIDLSSGASYQLGDNETIAGLKGAGSVDLNKKALTINTSLRY